MMNSGVGVVGGVDGMLLGCRRGLGGRQDLGEVHGADTGPLAGQETTDVHQAGVVTGDHDLGSRLADVPCLVRPHRHRRVRVLHRERAAEPAALGRAGQVDQSQAAHCAQQPGRPVPHPEHPQRVAGRVVGHRVREVRADVLDAEHVDEELRQLEHLGRHLLDRRGQAGIARATRDDRVLMAGRAGARPGGSHHGVVPGEGLDEVPHDRDRLVEIAGVHHRLRTAGLRRREVHVDTEAVQQPHDRLAGVGEHRVVDAGHHQRHPHTAHPCTAGSGTV